MKPILLSVAGLHSFREKQTIDFDLLSDAGVFGIFGPTGSGKSSILDAMTLALFGSVGRAKMGTQGILNHAEKQLEVSFQFEIGQAGSRQVYRVDRRYTRNDGLSVRNTYSRLVELDANGEALAVLADKNSDVDREVASILGLTEDDFMRAVVLPQGKFQEFLHLDGKKRREMLQRLFGLEQYGGILANRLNTKLQGLQSDNQSIQAHLDELGDASQEALEKARERLVNSQQLEAQAVQAYELAKQTHQQISEVVGWQNELNQVLRAIEQHEAQTSAMQFDQDALDKSTRAAAVVPLVEQLNQSKQSEQELRIRLATLQESVQAFTAEKKQAEDRYNTVVGLRKEREPKLYALQSKLEYARKQEEVVQRLRQDKLEVEQEAQRIRLKVERSTGEMISIESEQSQIEAMISDASLRLRENAVSADQRQSVQAAKQISDAYQQAQQALTDAQAELKRRRMELSHAEVQLRQVESDWNDSNQKTASQAERLAQLSQNCPTAEAVLSATEIDLTNLKHRAEQLKELEERTATDKRDLERAERAMDEHNAALSLLRVEADQLNDRLRMLRERVLQTSLQDRNALAARLAAELMTGEPCPVCGSAHHPNPAIHLGADADESHPAELDSMSTDVRFLEEQLDALRRKETDLLNDAAAEAMRAEGLRNTIEKQSTQALTWRTELGEALSAPGTSVPVSEFVRIIAEGVAGIQRQRAELQAWRTQVDEVNAALGQYREETSSRFAQFTAVKQRVLSAEQEVLKSSTHAEELQKRFLATQTEWDETRTKLGIHDVNRELDSMKQRDQVAEVAQRQLDELRNKHKVVLDRLADHQRMQSLHTADLTGLESKLQGCESQLQSALTELNAITKGKPAVELEQAVAKALAELMEDEQSAKLQLDKVAGKLSDCERERSQAEALHEQSLATLTKQSDLLQNKIADERFATVEEVLESRLSPDEFAERQAAIEAYRIHSLELNSRRRTLTERLGDRVVSDEEWTEIQEKLRAAESEKDQAKAEHVTARNDYAALQDRHEKWKTYQAQRTSVEKQLRQLSHLKDVLRGDRFVEFLAQEQLTYVAKQASLRLKRLTRDRYALEVGADGGFIMRDDANGGVRRPVTSLSGGETFLTSLALALSLSTQIQLRGKYPLEFFFLDEGFGTLDQELLDVVMATLEQLHLERMTIGVISHVPELQQRLHRRLIVDPAEPAGRGTRVRMERA